MSPTRSHFILPPPQERADLGRILLKDGATAALRPVQADDCGALSEFFGRLSEESRYRRFFSPVVPQAHELRALCENNNPALQFTLVVTRTLDGNSRIVASATYSRLVEGRAEVAFAVDDTFQGRGLGTLLLERLAIVAVRHGINTFEAFTLAENKPMIDLFRHSGFDITTRRDGSLVMVDLSLVPTEASVTRSAMRDRVATIASLRPAFQPRSVAVLGSFADPEEPGAQVVEALRRSGFRGAIYAVGLPRPPTDGIEGYPTLQALPEAPDLAVITLPAAEVAPAIDACAARGTRAVVVTSSGFADTGQSQGEALQKEIIHQARGYGMRLIGPNARGLLSSDPALRLNASLFPVMARHSP